MMFLDSHNSSFRSKKKMFFYTLSWGGGCEDRLKYEDMDLKTSHQNYKRNNSALEYLSVGVFSRARYLLKIILFLKLEK